MPQPESRYRKLKGLSPEENLYNFPKNQFQLNQNFSIGADGLTFHFSPGEIDGAAFGSISIFLPYADIQKLLRPGASIP